MGGFGVLLLLLPLAFSQYLMTIHNPNSQALTDFQVRAKLPSDLINKPITVTDLNGNPVPFCYETATGECTTDPAQGNGYIWIKVPSIPANGKTELIVKVGTNGAADPSQVFIAISSFQKHTLSGAHHSPNLDINEQRWGDANRDAFDDYGFTFLCNDPSNPCKDLQINIRPEEAGGERKYVITLGDRKFLVWKDVLPNQDGDPTVLRIILIPINPQAVNQSFSVFRYGDLGSDDATHSDYYRFDCEGVSYRCVMSWDDPDPGDDDPNIFYFMVSLYQGYDPNSYSYSRSGDDLKEYLRNAKGWVLMYLAPSDNPLGDGNIARFLCEEIRYFKRFQDTVVINPESATLYLRKYAPQEPTVAFEPYKGPTITVMPTEIPSNLTKFITPILRLEELFNQACSTKGFIATALQVPLMKSMDEISDIINIKHLVYSLYSKYLSLNSTVSKLNSLLSKISLQEQNLTTIFKVFSYLKIAKSQLEDFNNTYKVIRREVASFGGTSCKGNSTQTFEEFLRSTKNLVQFMRAKEKIRRNYGTLNRLLTCISEQTRGELLARLKYLEQWVMVETFKAEEIMRNARSALEVLIALLVEK